MSYISNVNIQSWNNGQVVDWLKGLDTSIEMYIPMFEKQEINGAQLLRLTYDLMECKLGIVKIGHQEVLLESIEALISLNYELPQENAQSLAISLSSDVIHLKHIISRLDQGKYYTRLPLSVLQQIHKITQSTKAMINWIDRPPFDSSQGYLKLKTQLLRFAIQMIQSAQHVTDSTLSTCFMTCDAVAHVMAKLITEKKDSLIVQPVFLQRAVLRKLPTQSLGMTLETSSYSGVHTIGSIAEESPTEACGNIDVGDEIIQVGHRTVVGWQLNNLVKLLKVTREVILTLKKRPRHNANGPDRRNNNGNTLTKSFRRSRKSSKRRVQSTKSPPTNNDVANDADSNTNNEKTAVAANECNENIFNCLSPRTLGSLQKEITSQVDPKQRRATVSGGSPRPGSTPGTPTATDASTTHSDNSIYRTSQTNTQHTTHDNDYGDDHVFDEDDTIVEEDEDKFEKDKNKLSIETQFTKDEEISDNEGYEIKIVGGVRIKTRMQSDEIAPLAKIQYRIKNKLHTRDARVESRRISCLLLGQCECKGWLWLRRSLSFLSEPWKKMWFALKDNRLYYYVTPESSNASGVLLMPMFTLSPAPEVKGKRKYAFKAYNKSLKFYFYSERQTDMSKWMNQLGLAAIDYNKASDNCDESAFSGSDDEAPAICEAIAKPLNRDRHAVFQQLAAKSSSAAPPAAPTAATTTTVSSSATAAATTSSSAPPAATTAPAHVSSAQPGAPVSSVPPAASRAVPAPTSSSSSAAASFAVSPSIRHPREVSGVAAASSTRPPWIEDAKSRHVQGSPAPAGSRKILLSKSLLNRVTRRAKSPAAKDSRNRRKSPPGGVVAPSSECAHESTTSSRLRAQQSRQPGGDAPQSQNVVRMRSTEEGKPFRNQSRAAKSIHDAGLGVDGRNMSTIRMTALLNANAAIDVLRSSLGADNILETVNNKRSSEKLSLHRQLAALKRTKMDMQQELLDIDTVLSKPCTENLAMYQTKYRQ